LQRCPRKPGVPDINVVNDAGDRVELRSQQGEIVKHISAALLFAESPLDRVPLRGLVEREIVSFNHVEAIENCRSLAIDIVHSLQPMVVRHDRLLITLKTLLKYVCRGCGLGENALCKNMNVPFQNLQLSNEIDCVPLGF